MILSTPIEELTKNLEILTLVVNERNKQELSGKKFTDEENKCFLELKKEHSQYEKAVELLKLAGIN